MYMRTMLLKSLALRMWPFILARADLNDNTRLTPKPIIIDTDMFSDVDDIGALAVANALHNCGKADLQAVIINTPSEYGSLAASVRPFPMKHINTKSLLNISQNQAINTYFSNPRVPIAALRPLNNATFHDTRAYRLGEYASKVAHNFPRSLKLASETPEPVDLYRSTLAAAPNNASITLISIGFLTNLAVLLSSSPDIHSPLAGSELVAQKVAELVVMGGRYPSGLEFNFALDAGSTKAVLKGWPSNVPITFSGYELGSKVFSGQRLPELAEKDSPVLAAYQWYGDRCNTTRASYDPVTAYYAVFGLGEIFEYGNVDGFNEVEADGRNAWVEDGAVTNQHWLRLKDGVDNEEVGEMLDQLYAHNGMGGCCFGECDGSMRVQYQ
jgi:inosine-uridine nucleoside N-ribohydrolase